MTEEGTRATRRYAKYVFLDVVQFSTKSAEAQSDVVCNLNTIVRGSLAELRIEEEYTLLLPTGDGMCIALISSTLTYDMHMRMALVILKSIDEFNKTDSIPESRRFQIRIGLNQNTDILIKDINDRPNIAGAGINLASRVMDKADGGQILVSQTVYDELQPSEVYSAKFHRFDAIGKHDQKFPVFQYVGTPYPGLSLSTPSEFAKSTEQPKLRPKDAYYFAHAISNRQFLADHQGFGSEPYSLILLLWFLASDSYNKARATDVNPFQSSVLTFGDSLDKQFESIEETNIKILEELSEYVTITRFNKLIDCFEKEAVHPANFLFISAKGKEKLKKVSPKIWAEFELDAPATASTL
jgi:class 3 adenylate cyclase